MVYCTTMRVKNFSLWLNVSVVWQPASQLRMWDGINLFMPPLIYALDRDGKQMRTNGSSPCRLASPRRICAVTRGFHTTTQDLSVFPFLPRHYHMTRVLQLQYHSSLYFLDTNGPCNNEHYLGHVKNVYDDDDDSVVVNCADGPDAMTSRTLSMAASTGSSSRLMIVSAKLMSCCLNRSRPERRPAAPSASARSLPAARHDRKLRKLRRSESNQCSAATITRLDDWPRRTIVIWSSVSKLENPASRRTQASYSSRWFPAVCRSRFILVSIFLRQWPSLLRMCKAVFNCF